MGRAELHRSVPAYHRTTWDPVSLWEPRFPHLNMELIISGANNLSLVMGIQWLSKGGVLSTVLRLSNAHSY